MSETKTDESKIQCKNEVLLAALEKFYKSTNYLEIIIPIVKGRTTISLRLLDWLVTNYAKKENIIYKTDSDVNFNIWLNYKCQLKAYSKKQFDPFCRRQRVYISYKTKRATFINKDEEVDEDKGLVTTVGQLNFFKWAILNNILHYAFENLELIENDMLSSVETSKSLKGKSKRRRELSKSASRSLTKQNIMTVVGFG